MSLRDVYAEKGLSQIPRLLGLEDRNPFSPTYGSFKRTYWLDKAVDFVDAQPQFGVLTLALAYHHAMPGNIYKDQPKMREWILAGMRYWVQIQHGDGSFDEFYPNERGWTGPTGFLLYSMLRSFMILEEREEFPENFKDAFFTACRKAAHHIIRSDEQGVLGNHHALAVLSVYYAYHVLGGDDLLRGYQKKFEDFKKTCHPEGWSLEYDGADPGYLSATVSFLGKVYKLNRDPELKAIMEKAVSFMSYFVYPNGFFAGSIGSRQTLHFYSHGCEILAPESPLAGHMADTMLRSLQEQKVVSAAFQADRYFLFRTAEHLESYVDYGERKGTASLPYEENDFRTVFSEGRFSIQKEKNLYVVASLAKGGVTKVFDIGAKKQRTSDCGVIGRTNDGAVLTSNWVDGAYDVSYRDDGFTVSGNLHKVPANTLFTPLTLIAFRIFTMLFCWNTTLAYHTKGFIRRMLMLKSGTAPIRFRRDVSISERVTITDEITLDGGVRFASLQLGDEFFVRYVPQSRYFQAQEFDVAGYLLNADELRTLNMQRTIVIRRTVS